MIDSNVDILLATYQGEKYLRELLESLINQTHKNISILVSDDGSTDSTWDIIKEYALKDSRIIPLSNTRNGGVINNFNNSLKYSTSDYIMFADQDDFWLSNKVEKMLKFLKEKEVADTNIVPTLAFSDLKVVDEKLDLLEASFYAMNGLNPYNNDKLNYLLWRSSVYGCTVMFNKSLLNKTPCVPDDVPMHDQWFALQAKIHGGIHYFPGQTIMYRQHESNVVGAHKTDFFSKLYRVNKSLKTIKKTAYKCIVQYKHIKNDGFVDDLLERNYGQLKFGQRVYFVFDNVFPFLSEKKIYALIFSFFFVFANAKQRNK